MGSLRTRSIGSGSMWTGSIKTGSMLAGSIKTGSILTGSMLTGRKTKQYGGVEDINEEMVEEWREVEEVGVSEVGLGREEVVEELREVEGGEGGGEGEVWVLR